MIRPLVAFAIGLCLLAQPAAAQVAQPLFGAKDRPSAHEPHAIGGHSRGCLAGGVQLPETGPTWQAMRLSRNHNWGHPSAIAFVERLSRVAVAVISPRRRHRNPCAT